MSKVQNQPKVVINGVQEGQSKSRLGLQALQVAQMMAEILLLMIQIFYNFAEAIYRIILPIEPTSVKGKIVLITGTGHGIGKELALLYASEGATVVGWDINEKNNEETMREIKERGYPKSYFYICDVSNRQHVFEVVKKVQKDVGDVSILINNAGIMPTHNFLDQSQDEIERVFKINVFAHFWILQALLPTMKKNNEGHIVALSSAAGLVGFENLVPYCGTKFAVRGMMEALHEELRRDNINVKITVIFPYMVNTGLCKRPRIKFASLMPMLEPKDVAEAIMDAQRKNFTAVSIPGYIQYMMQVARLFPVKAAIRIKDFFDSGVDPDL